jgi:hypothetical protein
LAFRCPLVSTGTRTLNMLCGCELAVWCVAYAQHLCHSCCMYSRCSAARDVLRMWARRESVCTAIDQTALVALNDVDTALTVPIEEILDKASVFV